MTNEELKAEVQLIQHALNELLQAFNRQLDLLSARLENLYEDEQQQRKPVRDWSDWNPIS